MSDQENNSPDDRRKALKRILAGTGAVTAAAATQEKWTKPVVESVLLPAHAATSVPGFSLTDPVSLTYTCSSSTFGSVIVDVGGYLNLEIGGITVHLRITATVLQGSAPAPIEVDVVTAPDGSYSSTGHNLGVNIASVTVVASLPEYEDAGTDTDTINPASTYEGSPYYTYYCAENS